MLFAVLLFSFGAITNAATLPGKSADCWSVTNSQHYPGLNQAPFNDIDSCLSHCFYKKDCYIVDFDTNTKPMCWVQSKAFDVKKSTMKPHKTVTNYILDAKCKVSDLQCWTITPQNHIRDLVNVPFTDVQSCLNHCIDLENCFAVDFDTNTKPPCWVQKKDMAVDIKFLKPLKTCTNFILNKDCKKSKKDTEPAPGEIKTSELECWTITPQKHIRDLVNVPFTDVQSCLNHCIDLEKCFAVDFDTNTKPPCWVQKKDMPVDIKLLKPLKTCTNYILNKDCKKSKKDTEPAPGEIKSQPSLTSSISKTTNSCWMTKNHTHYLPKGLAQVQKTNLIDCLKHCMSLPMCQVVDYDVATNPPCWVQTLTDTIKSSGFVSHPTANTYVLNRSCLSNPMETHYTNTTTYTEYEYVEDEE